MIDVFPPVFNLDVMPGSKLANKYFKRYVRADDDA